MRNTLARLRRDPQFEFKPVQMRNRQSPAMTKPWCANLDCSAWVAPLGLIHAVTMAVSHPTAPALPKRAVASAHSENRAK